MKCKLKQQQRIKIDNSYLEKLCKIHFKKPNLSIIDSLLNRLISIFQCKQIGYLQETTVYLICLWLLS